MNTLPHSYGQSTLVDKVRTLLGFSVKKKNKSRRIVYNLLEHRLNILLLQSGVLDLKDFYDPNANTIKVLDSTYVIHSLYSTIYGFSYEGMKIGDEFTVILGPHTIKQKITNTILQPLINGDPYYDHFAIRFEFCLPSVSREPTFATERREARNLIIYRVKGVNFANPFLNSIDNIYFAITNEEIYHRNVRNYPDLFQSFKAQEKNIRKAYINNKRKRGGLQFVNFY